MLQRCATLTGVPLRARAYSTVLSVCAVLHQRGGYQGRGGGPRFSYGGGGPPPRQQHYQQQGGGYGNRDDSSRNRGSSDRGYENRNQDYENHQQRYVDRPQRRDNDQQGYSNRRQNYDDRNQGYEDRRKGFNNRQQSFGNPQHDDDHQSAPRRGKEQYLTQDADKLLRMKHDYKKAKDTKERVGILKEARRLLGRTRIDPSTQDERSVAIVINCAATFSAPAKVEAVEQAFQWMRSNIGGISPQNVALFANALGLISPPEAREVMVSEVMPAVQSVMREMAPVEVVMVLQALQRLRVEENEKLQDDLLSHLEPCVSSMPVQQLSTLASVLHHHSMQARDNAKWKEIAHETLARALAGVDGMHSREAIVLLCAAPFLDASQKHICQLLARVTETVQFHTDSQVGELMSAILHIRQQVSEPSVELTAGVAALHTALMVRLEKVSAFVGARSATRIWNYAHASNVELPSAIQETMCASLIQLMTFRTVRFRALAQLMASLSTQKLPSAEILAVVANCSVGVRPPRPSKGIPPQESEMPEDGEDHESIRAAACEALYSRHFGTLTELRISLENAFGKNDVPPNDALAKTLPEHLLKHAAEALPRQMLTAVVAIALAPPDCPCRNKTHDAAVRATVLKALEDNPEKFKSDLSPERVDWFVRSIPANSDSAEIVTAVQKATAP
ncbi:mitochondrial oligo_U binding protein TBRGG1,putative [Leishmania mexicana MHOM/GT/2001/U1103]|uniref:Mitochondrial oligo_U binding protein TBRGG1,putative n=1 Tax=Leishmania mexicana (strain MHOM/GT/2001/U1103) TaxID=929439 RepID=E9B0K5_LEIMU|nr:mitochondrial oligo_U binding protein TBRGG1,putative [Leishmania mexicana MHOM/GT/2001/U1103]CBZ28760.1 mitochondrial oligo_U binding protein TBRGG1,putative [Leishmania mexicana MHOM/GT/2001/U1103]